MLPSSKIHIISYLTICFITICQSIVYAQKDISIKISNTASKVNPGGYFTLFFEALPPEGDSLKEISLELPETWQKILIKKTTKNRFLITLASGLGSAAGQYTLKFKTLFNNNLFKTFDFKVEIAKIRKIDIIPLTNFEYLKEGDSLHLDYLVQNLGNQSEKVKISTSNGKITLKSDSLAIAPNKSLHVRLSKKVPLRESNYWLLSNDLVVYLQDSLYPIAHYSSVPVFAAHNKKNDPYLRFPIEIGGGYSHYELNRGGYSGYQYSAKGYGHLDFDKQHYLDFTIHGPNQIALPALGSYDQYSLNYKYKNKFAISIGDYLLAYNNLMEFGRFGRGINVDYKLKKVGIMAFYLKPRFFPNQKDTYGTRLYYTPNNKLVLSLNYLTKNVKFNTDWLNVNFLGASLNYRSDRSSLNTEVAGSNTEGKYDFGVYNKFLLHINKLQLSSDLIYAGKNFYGFYHNSWQIINAVNYYLRKKISLSLQSNFTRVNPSFDTYVLNTSPYYSNNNLVLNYDVKSNQRMMLSYNIESNEDRQAVKTFHYQETYGKIAYMANSERFQLWCESRYGYATNYLINSDNTLSTRSLRIMIQPNVRLRSWFWLGAFFEYQNNSKFSTDNTLSNYFFYGVNSRLNISNKFNLGFSYRNNYAPDELVQRRNFLDLSAELNLKNHKISLMGGRVYLPNYTSISDNTLYFMLRYSFKLNTPIAKNKRNGAIKGSLSGGENLKKEGVLITLGDKKFMTDANGNFFFNDLPPSRYHLMIDRTSLENGIITTQKKPFEVEVVAQKTQDVSINLVLAGTVKGKIELSTGSDEKMQLPVLIIRLFNDKENFITKTNFKGIFNFSEVPPGFWQVEASIYGNKEQYYLETSSQNLNLENGKTQDITFFVHKKERKIYFSDKNFQVSSKR